MVHSCLHWLIYVFVFGRLWRVVPNSAGSFAIELFACSFRKKSQGRRGSKEAQALFCAEIKPAESFKQSIFFYTKT